MPGKSTGLLPLRICKRNPHLHIYELIIYMKISYSAPKDKTWIVLEALLTYR